MEVLGRPEALMLMLSNFKSSTPLCQYYIKDLFVFPILSYVVVEDSWPISTNVAVAGLALTPASLLVAGLGASAGGATGGSEGSSGREMVTVFAGFAGRGVECVGGWRGGCGD